MTEEVPNCILFSHINVPEEEYEVPVNRAEDIDSYRKICRYNDYLSEVLKEQRTKLFLFYDAAWVHFMNAVGVDFDFEKFVKGGYLALQVSEEFKSRGDTTPWVRVITVKELSEIVNNLRGDRQGDEALRWRRFFVSDQKAILYECSKVVEAIIRLRHIGSGIPVLRVDADVLDTLVEQEEQKRATPEKSLTLTGPNRETGADWLAKMLKRAKENHGHCVASTDVYLFVSSGGYRDEGEKIRGREQEKTPLPQGFMQWATAYSTRLYPALLARKELLEHSIKQPLEEFAGLVERELAFYDNVARGFYGLDSAEDAGIIKLGAHPRIAVISGSLFCLSDSAILNIPPASNFQKNVVWIDDHLKYALFTDLGQVGQKEIEVPSFVDEKRKRILTARIPHCYLPKGRQEIRNFGIYTLGTYLPSLLRGIIMDSWIYKKSKSRPNTKTGALTGALRLALARGWFPERDRNELRDKLKHLAFERIKAVLKEWSLLGGEKGETFASIWVKGIVQDHATRMGAVQFRIRADKKKDWLGWGLWTDSKRSETYNDLAPALRQDVENLVEDAITYIDWALEWPHFVQAVRVKESSALDLRKWVKESGEQE